jgi:2-desacetyl-2-hydroxyethyl bacteriochlorophyllide A dehydrogenase
LGVGDVGFEEFETRPPAEGEVAVRTLYSLISTGTELSYLNGSWEQGSIWDGITYPLHPGYAAVGEVTEVGPGVEEFTVGDRIATRGLHASAHVVATKLCTAVPDEIDSPDATWFALAKIAYMGARAAQHSLGDSVLVIGAGPIGQMAARWALAAGARVVVNDPVEARLALAQRGGVGSVISLPASDAVEAVRDAIGAAGADIVIDSTGNTDVFASTYALARPHGRIVMLGAPLGLPRLDATVMAKGLTIVGTHDGHSGMGDPAWDGDRAIHTLFFELVRAGRFSLDGLNTDVFDPSECQAAYAHANARRGDTVGIIFDWTGASP